MNAAPTEEPMGPGTSRSWRLVAMPAHLPPEAGPQNRFNGHYEVRPTVIS
jgi:hypothetical protein